MVTRRCSDARDPPDLTSHFGASVTGRVLSAKMSGHSEPTMHSGGNQVMTAARTVV